MNQSQREAIGKTWIAVAEIFGKELSKTSLPFMLNAVSDLEPEKVLSALQDWVRTSKLGRAPLPAEIREAVNPVIDKKAFAIDLARRIDKAISRHGYNWQDGFFGPEGTYWDDDKGIRHPSFKDAVISELGEIGWHVICSRGGWMNVRNSANDMEEGTFIAQMRDQISASVQLSEQGIDVARISMPTKNKALGENANCLTRLNLIGKVSEWGR